MPTRELTQKEVCWVLARLGGKAMLEEIAEKGGWSRPQTCRKLKSGARHGYFKRTKGHKWKLLPAGIDKIS